MKKDKDSSLGIGIILGAIVILALFGLLYSVNEKTHKSQNNDSISISNNKTNTTYVTTTKPTTTNPKTTKPTTTTKAPTTKPATTLSREEKNFRDLSIDDKVDILEWIQSTIGTDIDEDELWAEIADYYGITEDMVTEINFDKEATAALGRRRKAEREEKENSIEYDATLSYGNGSVIIGKTKDDLDEFLRNVSTGDDSAISVMLYEGRIAEVAQDTKAKVLDKKLTVTKVRVLDGLYAGYEGWTIAEAVHMK